MFKAFLFGPLRIIHNEETLALPTSVAARSLLAYLLLHNSRLALARVMWPEVDKELGVEPVPATVQLAEKIGWDAGCKTSPITPVPQSSRERKNQPFPHLLPLVGR